MPNLNLSLTEIELEELKSLKRKLQFKQNKDFSWKELIKRGLEK
jgi:hypothetical protein|tara:strand:- start:494 stop:625 length:132 start_codon:yes stop_codon:yes gene_type:complete